MKDLLTGKLVLITQALEFMGPALCEVFAEQGATVLASNDDLAEPAAAERVVHDAGHLDVLVANLACTAPSTPAPEVADDEWRRVFATLVDPLPRLVRAVAPEMIARRAGKILVIGSASALRGMKRASSYSAARGAQLAYVQAVGVELVPHSVRRAKTHSLPPICAAARPTASWARCFPSVVAGSVVRRCRCQSQTRGRCGPTA